MTLAPEIPCLVGVGFVAQLIDDCVGMGYGISASSILATLGVPPAVGLVVFLLCASGLYATLR